MADSVDTVLVAKLPSCLDEDTLNYLVSVVGDMTEQERRSKETLQEVIGPFLLDSGGVASEDEIAQICRDLSVAFGGSGFTSHVNTEQDEAPKLLAAPIKIGATLEFVKPNSAFLDVSLVATEEEIVEKQVRAEMAAALAAQKPKYEEYNSADYTQATTLTQRQLRKQKKANHQLQLLLRQENAQRKQQEEEIAAARMAAIRACRTKGKGGSKGGGVGVHLEKFCLPHPTGTGDLLTDVSLTMVPGRRYGLIGKNGAGKSTLLRFFAQYKLPELQHLRILLVDQHVEGDEHSALDWVLRADVERTALLEEEAKLEKHIHDPSGVLPPDLKGVNLQLALQEVYERMDVIGASTAEARARNILFSLGFDETTVLKPTNTLSGGWAMRAALAAALFVQPDLLLLDEPTNHLDLHALCWLEHYLTQVYSSILCMVSHDSVYLNSVCTDIIELKSIYSGGGGSGGGAGFRGSLTMYSGDYTMYMCIKEEHKINQARLREKFEKEKEKLTEFVSREGKKYDNPAHQAQRKMKLKQLEKMIEVEKVDEEADLILRFPSPYCSIGEDEVLIDMVDVGFRWSSEEDAGGGSAVDDKTPLTFSTTPPPPPLFQSVNITIRAKDRIAILGKNGCGKTSFLNLLVGEGQGAGGEVSGIIRRHVGSRCTMLQQHHYKGEQLEPHLSPLDHLRKIPQSESSAVGLYEMNTRKEESAHRSYLACFGIYGAKATLPVRYLSGGQRMRVALAIAMYMRPDLLILDEPTNHLDTETSAALIEAVQDFQGAIVVVSHDETFVTKVVSDARLGPSELPGSIYVLSRGALKKYDGSFRDYKKVVLKKMVRFDG